MPQFDAANVTVALPLWAAAALLVLLVAVCILALRRSATPGSVAALFGIPALIVIAWAAWSHLDRSILLQHAVERQALDARAAQLTVAAMTPGSALACLDAVAGQAVEAACERALFVSPEAVAAAVAYVEARLRLLADGLDYARRADGGYRATLAGLRRAIESDRFGFVAHVLATRDGCTPEQCEAFALLRDAGAVKANLQARTYEGIVARYAPAWSEPMDASMASPAAETPAKPENPGAAATKPIEFPSAASIPPVSIMNANPPGAAAAGSEPAEPRAPASPPAADPAAPRAP
ncbi:MAG: hypothetical protein WD073_10700 [Xanthobacteraceae bacterium]